MNAGSSTPPPFSGRLEALRELFEKGLFVPRSPFDKPVLPAPVPQAQVSTVEGLKANRSDSVVGDFLLFVLSLSRHGCVDCRVVWWFPESLSAFLGTWSFSKKVLSGTFLLLLFASLASAASHRPAIQGIRTISSAEMTRVVISLSGPIAYELIAEPSTITSTSPARLYVRFSPASLAPGVRATARVDDGILKEIRTGLIEDSVIRVSLEVDQLGTYRATAFRSPDQIVIQLRKQQEKRFPSRPPTQPVAPNSSAKVLVNRQVAMTPLPPPSEDRQRIPFPPPSLPSSEKASVDQQAAITPPLSPLALPPTQGKEPTPTPPMSQLRYRIMLDPGHGGSDPGAQSSNGVQEKTVVLAVSKRLAQKLRTRLGAEVMLTRTDDVFIPLPERTTRANATKADLFISIHANASPNPETQGVETYFLNNTNDRATIRLAKLENGMREKQQLPQQETSLSYILSDLIQTGKEEESIALAQAVQTALIDQVRTSAPLASDLGVKKGPFYVLVGAHMPCVLVELAFLSHPEEAQRLGSTTYQETLAEGLFQGIADFLRTGLSAKNL